MARPVALYGPRTMPKPRLSPITIHPTDPNGPCNFVQQQQQQKQQQQQVLPPTPPHYTKPEAMTVSAKSLMHHPLQPDFAARYTLGEELGSGGFGFVLSAIDRITGVERAVKFILRNKVPAHAWVCDRELGPVPMEIYVLKHVKHPNVVNFVDFFQDETFIYLVMELHGTQWSASTPALGSTGEHSPALSQTSTTSFSSHTPPTTPIDEYPFPRSFARRTSCDLFECIERHHNLEEPLARMIFKQIVDCVAYLDLLGICHRDIKDENIVIDDQYKVKFIDFGSSVILPRHYGQNKPCYFNKFYGTVSFASPEILMCRPYRAEPAEVWALGVLLYTILFGEVPFMNPNMAIAGHFVTPKIKVSPSCMNLLACMLERSPEKRINVHQVQAHPWFHQEL